MDGVGATAAMRSASCLQDRWLSPPVNYGHHHHHQSSSNSSHQNQHQCDDIWSSERNMNTFVTNEDFSVDDLLNWGGIPEEELEQPLSKDETGEQSLCNDDKSFNSNSSSSLFQADLSEPLMVPEGNILDLEWVSQIVDDSSFFDIPSSAISPAYLPLTTNHSRSPSSGSITSVSTSLKRIFPSFSDQVLVVPSKTRTKRTRTGNHVWSLHHPQLAEPMCSSSVSSSSSCSSTSSMSSCLVFDPKPINTEAIFTTNAVVPRGRGRPPLHKKKSQLNCDQKDQNKQKKKGRKPKAATTTTEDAVADGGSGRRCSHCGVQKTPQWRAGPLGAKTLCNACGVRFKSGRLLPEYRPAISPTFLDHAHSNSHRKVLEMRRKKELQQQQLFVAGDSVAVATPLPVAAQPMVF